MSILSTFDPEISQVIEKEKRRQIDGIELIASENYVSEAVLEATASILTNKYAEGYPSKRYYGGCEVIDIAEELAIERAKKLFGAEHANVQPYSGSNPNFGVYVATCEPGDTIMGMELTQGGHLTHGSPVNLSGKLYHFVPYGVDYETERIDYDEMLRLAKIHKPKILLSGATAYSREIDFKRIREICNEVGAYMMVDMAHIAGLIAADEHPDPVPYADFVTTSTHKTLRGPRGGMILCKEKYAKDIDKAIFPGIQGGPLLHVIAAKAVALKEAMQPSFKTYAKQIKKNAKALAEALSSKGLRIVSGGTDNHLMLVDFGKEGPTGKEVQHALEEGGITVNKNTVPRETRSPFVTSGIRLGTPATTTRGFKEQDMKKVAAWIVELVEHLGDEKNTSRIRKEVRSFCRKFPIPGMTR